MIEETLDLQVAREPVRARSSMVVISGSLGGCGHEGAGSGSQVRLGAG